MAAEKPTAKFRRNFFALLFRTAAAKKFFIFFSYNRDKILKPQKVCSSHFANIENKHKKPQKVGSESEAS